MSKNVDADVIVYLGFVNRFLKGGATAGHLERLPGRSPINEECQTTPPPHQTLSCTNHHLSAHDYYLCYSSSNVY